MTLGGERIVEIKCPVKGRDSTLWKTVEAGRLPEHYALAGPAPAHGDRRPTSPTCSCSMGPRGLSRSRPDPSTWPRIHAAWDTFMRCVTTRSPPPLSKGDVRERDDPEWLAAAAAFLESKVRRSSCNGSGRSEGAA